MAKTTKQVPAGHFKTELTKADIREAAKHGIIATPLTADELKALEPKVPVKKVKKPVCPEMSQRKIKALDKFLSDGDINLKQYHTMKDRIIADMVGAE
jgi:hypothetical protein